jgi:hypothetical protein
MVCYEYTFTGSSNSTLYNRLREYLRYTSTVERRDLKTKVGKNSSAESKSSKLDHHLVGVAQLVQGRPHPERRVAGHAQVVVHPRDPAHEDSRAGMRRERVRRNRGAVHPPDA